MERCHHKKIKLNASEVQVKLKELKLLGTIISDKEMRPDPDKVAAITKRQQSSTCAQYGHSAPKEPMKSLPIPARP